MLNATLTITCDASYRSRDTIRHGSCGPQDRRRYRNGTRLAELASLGDTDIENGLAANLSADLHSLFDPVADGALPIYFGPLLGRLYLEGL